MLGDATGVIRTGPVAAKEIPAYLSAAEVGLLPLRNTGANRGRWPLKLSDYMAAGRPTVATAVGDLPEVIGSYELGVTTSDTPEDLASAVLTLLDDEARRHTMGAAARRAAETDFSWEHLTDHVESLYLRALK
jgi:glycosyltransferase involved in cell wall biosynthesis